MMDRRRFLRTAGAASVATLGVGCSHQGPGDRPRSRPSVPQGPAPGAPRASEITLPAGGTMPIRALGRTGEQTSVVGMGGYHLGLPGTDREAIRLIHEAMDHGVTFMDNCWDYHKGESERRMGKALQGGRRQKVFLMSKIDGRTREAAQGQIEQSLKRLKTDRLDLMQIHEVIRPRDPQWVFGPGGAVEALVKAREQGKIRYIGFTGHKDPEIHLQMLKVARDNGFRFDAVQMPLNLMDHHYDSFERKVLPELQREGIAVLAMKPLGSGLLLKAKVASATRHLHYAMSLETAVVITGCETRGVLKQAMAAAYTYEKPSQETVSRWLAETRAAARRGQYEKYKTTGRFDGTARNPRWLTMEKM